MPLYTRSDHTLETYPDSATPRGGIFRLLGDEYLQMEAHEEASNYSILWATDKGAIESLEVALKVFGKNAFVKAAVAEKGTEGESDAYGEGEAGDVVTYVKEEADLDSLCYVRLDGQASSVIWSGPAKRFIDSTKQTAELSMMVHGAPQASVGRFIAETAMGDMLSRYADAMTELRAVIPNLPQV